MCSWAKNKLLFYEALYWTKSSRVLHQNTLSWREKIWLNFFILYPTTFESDLQKRIKMNRWHTHFLFQPCKKKKKKDPSVITKHFLRPTYYRVNSTRKKKRGILMGKKLDWKDKMQLVTYMKNDNKTKGRWKLWTYKVVNEVFPFFFPQLSPLNLKQSHESSNFSSVVNMKRDKKGNSWKEKPRFLAWKKKTPISSFQSFLGYQTSTISRIQTTLSTRPKVKNQRDNQILPINLRGKNVLKERKFHKNMEKEERKTEKKEKRKGKDKGALAS